MTASSTPESDDTRTWKDSVDVLCAVLDISKDDLFSLLADRWRYYHVQHRVSPSGKHRTFYSARGRLLAIQTKLNNWLKRLPVHEAAHGWRKNRSYVTAAAMHVGKPCVINLDIADFFPTVSPRRVRNLYLRLGCSFDIANVLTRLTTWKSHLAQGLKTSPAIANLVMVEIDKRIDIACRNMGFTYTRYGDDITLSGGKGTRQIESVVKSILRQTGFQVKNEKTERNRQHARQTVLKLVVNRQPDLPREKRRLLRAIAHNCLAGGIAFKQQDGEIVQKTEAQIQGSLSHWAQVNSKSAQSSLRKFQQAQKRKSDHKE